jgi:O-methyltransferase involved in polyketide biosynthesis
MRASTRVRSENKAEVVYFEIDDETTLSYKKAGLAENHLTADVSFTYGNYVTDDFIHLLLSKDSIAPVPPISFGKAIRCI